MIIKLDERGFVIQDGSTGHDWRKTRNAKKAQEAKGGRTPGRLKGENCKATPLQRFMARRNRSYKHRLYSNWYITKDGTKKAKPK